ncbi:MAG: arsenate-mycothiol transferase ArsC [Limisphaerales bacterium]
MTILLHVGCGNAGADTWQTSSSSPKQILFVCTGNFYRSRFAEVLFNQKASASRVHWKATSRGLALVRSQHGISPIALRELTRRGVPMGLCKGPPKTLTQEDLEQSDYIILMNEAEHRVMFEKQFPNYGERNVHYWHIRDSGSMNATQACQQMTKQIDELLQKLPK